MGLRSYASPHTRTHRRGISDQCKRRINGRWGLGLAHGKDIFRKGKRPARIGESAGGEWKGARGGGGIMWLYLIYVRLRKATPPECTQSPRGAHWCQMLLTYGNYLHIWSPCPTSLRRTIWEPVRSNNTPPLSRLPLSRRWGKFSWTSQHFNMSRCAQSIKKKKHICSLPPPPAAIDCSSVREGELGIHLCFQGSS